MNLFMQIARRSELSHPEACAPLLALLATARVMHTYAARELASLNLTENQLVVLMALYGHGTDPLDLDGIARISNLDPISAQAILDYWVTGGHVKSVHNPDTEGVDGVWFRLSPTGGDFIKRAVQPFFKLLEHCALGLTPGERHVLSQACGQLCAELAALPPIRQPNFA